MSGGAQARAAVVPSAPYLTPGKLYAAGDVREDCFTIIDDEGDKIFCLWAECAHLDGESWERLDAGERATGAA